MTLLPVVLAVLTSSTLAPEPQSQPAIANGDVAVRPVTGDLAATMRREAASATDALWIGYAVPAVAGGRGWDGGRCGVTLEPNGATRVERRTGGTVALEPAAELIVMARAEGGRIVRLRSFASDCRIDAGGRAVHWLSGVAARDSVSWLASFLKADERRLADGALSALAGHEEGAALDHLLSAARDAESARTRGQALFWLSQRAGQRAVGAIAEAVERDPDTAVKKRAVFALAQLPDGEGVPKLIEVARGHSNKAVQKQAFFWLGQSKDPRALAFFREVLR